MTVLADELSMLMEVPALKNQVSENELLQLLTEVVSLLIEKDFNRLVTILYRVDVNESILKAELKDESDAATTIARLLLQRQKQKLALRKQFTKSSKDISEEDRW